MEAYVEVPEVTLGEPRAGTVELLNQDCVRGAFQLQRAGHSVALLNMCNPTVKGGYYHLAGAQEEGIVRASDYLTHLAPVQYPVPDHCVVYTPAVHFHGHKKPLAIIACAALRQPNLSDNGRFIVGTGALVMAMKIDHIFTTAWRHGHTALVLSAFGCGGFRNPPEHVSALFASALRKWRECFDVIRFCIFDECHPASNFAVFRSTLSPFLGDCNK